MRKLLLATGLLFISISGLRAQDSTAFTEFYGKYQFKEGSPVTEASIEWVDNQLYMITSMGNASTTENAVDSFCISYADGIVVFSRDSATKKINGLSIFVTGMVLEATKSDPEKTTGLIKMPAKREEPIAMNQ